jgi:sugar lactone lactonase YvrE
VFKVQSSKFKVCEAKRMRCLLNSIAVMIVLFLTSGTCLAQDEPPAGVWTIDKGLAQPESVYYDAASQSVFISSLAGSPTEKDGKGWITRADVNGKVLDAEWVKGLNAPKGMRSANGILWVSDIDRVIGIEIKTAKIKHTIEVKDANFLNDVAVDNEGVVYVSDMFGNKIYSIKEGKASVFAEGEDLALPNGLVVHEDQLVVASWGTGFDPANFTTKTPGRLYEIDLGSRRQTNITKRPLGNLDGVELDGSGGYFVSDWITSKVYRVTSTGEATPVISGLKGPADIGVIDSKSLLLVPRMLEDKVTAYSTNE